MVDGSTYNGDALRLIFSGGGTGGHIYPAIAVAQEIRDTHPDAEILFVGALGKLEMIKVPQAGFKIVGLWISGLQRRLALRNLLFPIKVLASIINARRILKTFNPHVVAGFGGYASGPIMMAATRKGIKTLIQEQNSYAGIANKSVAKKVEKICVAYDKMDRFFPANKIVNTGNPVRRDLMDLGDKRTEGFTHFDLDPNRETILVMGGSMGARTINESVVRNVEKWTSQGKQLLWQTGKIYHNEMLARLNGKPAGVSVLEYIDRMDLAYSVADVIVSRAGALAISELCLVGKPVVFVPSPNVAEDHQRKNAMALKEKDAAVVVDDKTSAADLPGVTLSLLDDPEERKRLSENIALLAKPDAAQHIAKEILELASENAA